MTINQFLVSKLKCSHTEALRLITSKLVFINNELAIPRSVISSQDKITVDNQLLQVATRPIYIAYYKPRGIECTLNKDIPQNLASILPFEERLFPIGRLDKDSEGLLLLTNDGKYYKAVAPKEASVEKEYIVEVIRPLMKEDLEKMRLGMVLMGRQTNPCSVALVNEYTFSIVLTEGMNRQIRRMCYKLNYEIKSLTRVRIGKITLQKLLPGEYYPIVQTTT